MRKKESVIGRLLASLASDFTPENFMRARRLVSYADEDNGMCKRCEKQNAIGGCGLCFNCATNALTNLTLKETDHVLPELRIQ